MEISRQQTDSGYRTQIALPNPLTLKAIDNVGSDKGSLDDVFVDAEVTGVYLHTCMALSGDIWTKYNSKPETMVEFQGVIGGKELSMDIGYPYFLAGAPTTTRHDAGTSLYARHLEMEREVANFLRKHAA
ncbi:MAG: hypothetical protein Q8O89_03615 [Nanoarchaeota archaeon]|nr:hypothetical protein [Nanoarchaeota archaeon]